MQSFSHVKLEGVGDFCRVSDNMMGATHIPYLCRCPSRVVSSRDTHGCESIQVETYRSEDPKTA